MHAHTHDRLHARWPTTTRQHSRLRLHTASDLPICVACSTTGRMNGRAGFRNFSRVRQSDRVVDCDAVCKRRSNRRRQPPFAATIDSETLPLHTATLHTSPESAPHDVPKLT
eukprot:352562-Chlamydomonas_euryale.AAC.5